MSYGTKPLRNLSTTSFNADLTGSNRPEKIEINLMPMEIVILALVICRLNNYFDRRFDLQQKLQNAKADTFLDPSKPFIVKYAEIKKLAKKFHVGCFISFKTLSQYFSATPQKTVTFTNAKGEQTKDYLVSKVIVDDKNMTFAFQPDIEKKLLFGTFYAHLLEKKVVDRTADGIQLSGHTKEVVDAFLTAAFEFYLSQEEERQKTA